MATVTKATRGGVAGNSWTNPGNALTDNGVYSTCAPAKNGTVVGDWDFAAFTDAEIPPGSTIDQVRVKVNWKASSSTLPIDLTISGVNNGTTVGSATDNTPATTDSDITYTFTTTPSETDLKTAGRIVAHLAGHRGNTNTAVTISADYVEIAVDYTEPPPVIEAGKVESGTERISNPGVETDAVGWDPWVGTTMTRDTTKGHSGSACLKATTTGAGANAYVGIQTDTVEDTDARIDAGKRIRVRVWVQVETGGDYRLESGNAPSTWNAVGATTTLTAGDWTMLDVIVARPVTDTSTEPIRFALWKIGGAKYATGESAYFDDMSILALDEGVNGADVAAGAAPQTLDAGKVSSGAAVRGADLTAGTATLAAGKVTSPELVQGADLTPGTATLSAGKVTSSQAVRGADLAAPATLDAGKIASPAAVRGADPAPSGAASLQAGAVPSSEAVHGADLTPGTVTLPADKVTSSELVRGADLATGAAGIAAGHVASAEAVQGADLTPGTATLSAGKVTSSEAVHGADVDSGVSHLQVGKITGDAAVNGADLTPGTASLAPGKVGPGAAVRGVTLTAGAVTLAVGKVGGTSTVRGVELGQGASTLSPGKIAGAGAVRGVTVTAGTATLTVGKLASTSTVRGADFLGVVPEGMASLRVHLMRQLRLTAAVGSMLGRSHEATQWRNLVKGRDVQVTSEQLTEFGHPMIPADVADHPLWTLSGDNTLTPV